MDERARAAEMEHVSGLNNNVAKRCGTHCADDTDTRPYLLYRKLGTLQTQLRSAASILFRETEDAFTISQDAMFFNIPWKVSKRLTRLTSGKSTKRYTRTSETYFLKLRDGV